MHRFGGIWSDLTLQALVAAPCMASVASPYFTTLGRGSAVSIDFSKIGKCGNFLRMSGVGVQGPVDVGLASGQRIGLGDLLGGHELDEALRDKVRPCNVKPEPLRPNRSARKLSRPATGPPCGGWAWPGS
jgi:hypothetical protein